MGDRAGSPITIVEGLALPPLSQERNVRSRFFSFLLLVESFPTPSVDYLLFRFVQILESDLNGEVVVLWKIGLAFRLQSLRV